MRWRERELKVLVRAERSGMPLRPHAPSVPASANRSSLSCAASMSECTSPLRAMRPASASADGSLAVSTEKAAGSAAARVGRADGSMPQRNPTSALPACSRV